MVKKIVENNSIKTPAGSTKDIIRNIYHKMVVFMDGVVRCARLNKSEYFEIYEEELKEIEKELHMNILDIPVNVYDQLYRILEEDFKGYVYGYEGDTWWNDVWDYGEYRDFLEDKDLEDGAIVDGCL